MHLRNAILSVAAAASLVATVAASHLHPVLAADDAHLQQVLSQMDAASKTFKSAQADIKRVHLEKVVNDTSTENGTVYFMRTGSTTQFGGRFEPDLKIVEYKNGTVRLYTAANNHIDQVSATGSNQGRVETFLTLGFGGSGADLAKAWDITAQGTEQISDGAKTVQVEKLDLVSKDPSVKNNYSHITIWVDPMRDVSLKQEFFDPGGNTDTATYSNVRLNQPIDLKPYTIACKGKCS
ncbi:MAG TPA: outer membrane lipoprotein-sorting protein [Acidobacteriaceae bacterium]|jgi:outer membrane lipoprotein-sorting protein|nr:outer membrane lipoprotein-sorting protein [Acidobacteriaceae bacterium]